MDFALSGNSHIVPTIRGFSLGRFFPFQMTGRSSSVADMCENAKLRAAAAGTRRLLVSRAAKRFDRPPREIELEAGYALARDGLIAWAFTPGPDRDSVPGDLNRLKTAARIWAPMLENPTWCEAPKEAPATVIQRGGAKR